MDPETHKNMHLAEKLLAEEPLTPQEVEQLERAQRDGRLSCELRTQIGAGLAKARNEGRILAPGGKKPRGPKAPKGLRRGAKGFAAALKAVKVGDEVVFDREGAQVAGKVNRVTPKTLLVEQPDTPDFRVFKDSVEEIRTA